MVSATTIVGAAKLAGVTPASLRAWIKKGWLHASPPWTQEQIDGAGTRSRHQARRGTSQAEHGVDRWRLGCHCDICLEAHNADSRGRRAEARAAEWARKEAPLLAAITSGAVYREACDEVGVTPQAVTAQRRRDPDFAQRLDEALMIGRDPTLRHGTSSGWRKCRCPECRAYHEAAR